MPVRHKPNTKRSRLFRVMVYLYRWVCFPDRHWQAGLSLVSVGMNKKATPLGVRNKGMIVS